MSGNGRGLLNGDDFDPPVLVCPGCDSKEGYTHAHGQAEIYDERPGEGRWSFRIPMYCEQCSGEFDLIIEQHKGQTYIRTVARPNRIGPQCADMITAVARQPGGAS